MIAVFLAGIGAAYLFRNYLVHRFREISILMSLGATRQQTYRMVLWQLGLLGTGAAFIAIIISLAILPLLPLLLKQFLPNGFETQLSLGSLLFALVLGGVGSLVFCLPVLSRIRTVQPLQLFHKNIGQQDVTPVFWRPSLELSSASDFIMVFVCLAVSLFDCRKFFCGDAAGFNSVFRQHSMACSIPGWKVKSNFRQHNETSCFP